MTLPTTAWGRSAVLLVALVVAVLATTMPTTAYAQQPGPKNESDCAATATCERSPPHTTGGSGGRWRVELALFVSAAVLVGVGYRVLVTRMAGEP